MGNLGASVTRSGAIGFASARADLQDERETSIEVHGATDFASARCRKIHLFSNVPPAAPSGDKPRQRMQV
ncbi:hypothetical protein R69888_03786 [Paraburkholderia haematera]|jgi:hypothetical protein|uniref:Uncharacterized protein n=1 Tax=Paraburkholderia haematera TaxID=2793077 RepID=A0ABM8RSF8_9BURK|nr:hypothetical protein R69888_03786 [Paraburkholderia haematera]